MYVCIFIYINIINIHSTHSFIMSTINFILDSFDNTKTKIYVCRVASNTARPIRIKDWNFPFYNKITWNFSALNKIKLEPLGQTDSVK